MGEPTPKGRVYGEILAEVFCLRALMLESAERQAASVGLTSARWQTLGAIEDQPAPVAQVARRLGLTRQSVQETADAMAREGLLTFRDNPGHKRARLMSPTPRARKALAQLRPRQVEFANVMASAHPLEALHTTLDVLRSSRTTIEGNLRTRLP